MKDPLLSRNGPPPPDLTYRCHGCRGRFDISYGEPKAGLCTLCAATLASPRIVLAIAERCSENPPEREEP